MPHVNSEGPDERANLCSLDILCSPTFITASTDSAMPDVQVDSDQCCPQIAQGPFSCLEYHMEK